MRRGVISKVIERLGADLETRLAVYGSLAPGRPMPISLRI